MAASMQTFFRNFANIRLFSHQRTVQAVGHCVQQFKYCSTETEEDFYDPREEYEEWEIEELRNVSRLPEKEILDRRVKSRNQYEAFYRQVPIEFKPRWPSKEELLVMKEYETLFEPSVETMIKEAREKRMKWETRNTKRILTVEKNMSKMEKMIQDLRNKEIQKKEKEIAALKRREERIEAVRKQLGTRLRPTDKRVKLLMAEKEKAEEKAEKLRKKQEKEEKVAEKLRVLAETQ